jgi:YVTN family beta-propeller protein
MEAKDEPGQRLVFGEFVLDLQNAALTRRGEPIPLSPKEFELLCLLVVHAGRLVEKETLIRRVWPDTFVSDSSLLRTISVLRKHLGHDSIRTLPKRGYAFVLPVVRLENGREFHLSPGRMAQDALGHGEQSVDVRPARSSDGEHRYVPTSTSRLSDVLPRRTSLRLGWSVTVAVIAMVVLITTAIGFVWLQNRTPSHRTSKSADGFSPEQAAVAGRLLVLNQHANSISVLDTLSKSVESTIPIFSDPRGVAILPDSTSVYVSMNGANSVAVLDVRSGRVLATIPVGRNPVGVVANPRPPSVYVANNYSNTVSVVDSVTRTVVRTLSVGSVPTEIAVAGDGTLAIVTNQSGGSISIIDAVANAVLTTMAVGSTPVGVAFTPDSKFAWVTLAGGNEVAVINVTTERIVRRIPVGASPVRVTLSRDGGRALVSNFLSNTITVVDTASLKPIQKIHVGLNPVGVVFNPAGDLAYVANYGSNTVSVIDTSTMKVLATVQVGTNPVELAILPCYVVPCGLPWQQAPNYSSGARKRLSE